MQQSVGSLIYILGLLILAVVCQSVRAETVLERDWMRQLEKRFGAAEKPGAVVTPAQDASHAVDGKTDEPWGFHTEIEENPWWQVDLGENRKMDRVVIHNRGDAHQERASQLKVSVSLDGKSYEDIFQNTGKSFGTGDAALLVPCAGKAARFLRLQLPGKSYFHLNEVQVFAVGRNENIALKKPATQSSVSQWSKVSPDSEQDSPVPLLKAASKKELERGQALAKEFELLGKDKSGAQAAEKKYEDTVARLTAPATDEMAAWKSYYFGVRKAVRELCMASPLLDFDKMLVTKLIEPGWIYHMSDQYYGWWSRPGGGIYILEDFKSGSPKETCLTSSFAPGCFQRPTLSYDAKKILFAYCKFYESLAQNPNKIDKPNMPEDSYYHLFEMNVDGTGLKQLTVGKYNDFDGRYLPDGRIVFLSTRRGHAIQYTQKHVDATQKDKELPESYVRCGGDTRRPVAVYTLHTIAADGSSMKTISPFEMFEWTPAVANDGRIIYARWDYIDRSNQPYMGLWSTNPDGTSPSHVFKNYTESPNTVFEAVPIPHSRKLVFTGGAHHANTGGTLVLLDPSVGEDGPAPMTRLTPEVPFPETETRSHDKRYLSHYYASPWPLSETTFLTAWSWEGLISHFQQSPGNGMGVYYYDIHGNLELLCADEAYQVQHPIPLRARPVPPIIQSQLPASAPLKGTFMLTDVYNSRQKLPDGSKVTHLRLVAVPPKTHPRMNFPEIGLTRDDPGKCVLGTVPVEKDGSAYFEAPSNMTLFFQALNEEGLVIQTMRSATYLQPGNVLSCNGCHEDRHAAQQPMLKTTLASQRAPSKISPDCEGSAPFRFDRLVFPVLKNTCAACHTGKEKEKFAFSPDPYMAWQQLTKAGKPSIAELVSHQYRSMPYSNPGENIASKASLTRHLRDLKAKNKISDVDYRRLLLWMDIYGQYLGSFSDEQEKEQIELLKNMDVIQHPI
jgi:hypothetical protein